MSKSNPTVEEAIIHLLNTDDRFYAEIILQMNRVWTTSIPTLGVSIAQRPVQLIINPKFWDNPKYTMADKVFFLKHECAHLIADHGARANGPFTPLHNVAADMAVHELIPPPMKVFWDGAGNEGRPMTVEMFAKKIPGLERNKTMEYYFAALQQAGEGGGEGSMDDHGGLEAKTEAAKAVAREIVQRAVDGCKQGGDKVPNALRHLIDELLSSAVDWKRELRSFPDYAEIAYYEDSRRIRNRRYGLQYPGQKKIRKVKLAVGFDVSGSIDDELAKQIAGEIKHIADAGSELDVIFFDHAVQEIRPWSEDFLKNGVPGGGGTLFQPPLTCAADELDCDGVIMITDGMNADTISDPGIPVIWAILPGFQFKCDFGKVIHVEKPE